MYSLNQLKTLVSCGRDPARSLPLRRGFLLIPLVLVCFAFAPQTQAVSPTPDGCYPGFTTAEGCNALNSNTSGNGNTAVGFIALSANTTGNQNSANGYWALRNNTSGSFNTANGSLALSTCAQVGLSRMRFGLTLIRSQVSTRFPHGQTCFEGG